LLNSSQIAPIVRRSARRPYNDAWTTEAAYVERAVDLCTLLRWAILGEERARRRNVPVNNGDPEKTRPVAGLSNAARR